MRHVLSRRRLYRGWPGVSAPRGAGGSFCPCGGAIPAGEILELRTLMVKARHDFLYIDAE
jgi:hypothetical protein